jgi:predicted ArsR family transcriptional regulator
MVNNRTRSRKGIPGSAIFGNGEMEVLFLILSEKTPLTVDEIAAIRGVCKNAAHAQLVRLRKKGLITWEDGKCRTIVPTCTLEITEEARGK